MAVCETVRVQRAQPVGGDGLGGHAPRRVVFNRPAVGKASATQPILLFQGLRIVVQIEHLVSPTNQPQPISDGNFVGNVAPA